MGIITITLHKIESQSIILYVIDSYEVLDCSIFVIHPNNSYNINNIFNIKSNTFEIYSTNIKLRLIKGTLQIRATRFRLLYINDIEIKQWTDLKYGELYRIKDLSFVIVPQSWYHDYTSELFLFGEYLSIFNYAVITSNFQIISYIKVLNIGKNKSKEFNIYLYINKILDQTIINVPEIMAHSEYKVLLNDLKIKREYLESKLIAEKSYLIICHNINGTINEKRIPINILGFWDYPFDKKLKKIISLYSLPNDSIVEQIIHESRLYLSLLSNKYDSYYDINTSYYPNAEKIILKSIYNYIKDKLSMHYDFPVIADDKYQTIRSPQIIFHLQRATCLDISLLFCGLFENIHLSPLLIFDLDHNQLPKHSLVACWKSTKSGTLPIISNTEYIKKCINEKQMLALDCIGCTKMNNRNISYDQALMKAIRIINKGKQIYAIDISACRSKPDNLYPLESPCSDIVKRIFTEAHKFAKNKKRKLVEVSHIFYGVVYTQGPIIKKVLCEIDKKVEDIQKQIFDYVEPKDNNKALKLSMKYNRCKWISEKYARERMSSSIQENDLIRALMDLSTKSIPFKSLLNYINIDAFDILGILNEDSKSQISEI